MKYKIIHTSDLHGNEEQYKKLAELSKHIHPDSIIIGGDIAPKDFNLEEYIEKQREFLEYKLPELLNVKGDIDIFLIMGNDDCSANIDILEKNTDYDIIHNKRTKLTEDFEVAGYSYVPITPFGIKDWEKYDLRKDKYETGENHKNYNGYKSTKSGWSYCNLRESEETIQDDLSDYIFCKNPEKTEYIIHTPPYYTSLDICIDGTHIGSKSVKLFIEEHKPYLTLHGHVHETVNMSGDFKQKIGDTVNIASGNDNRSNKLSLIVFDLYDLNNINRITL